MNDRQMKEATVFLIALLLWSMNFWKELFFWLSLISWCRSEYCEEGLVPFASEDGSASWKYSSGLAYGCASAKSLAFAALLAACSSSLWLSELSMPFILPAFAASFPVTVG